MVNRLDSDSGGMKNLKENSAARAALVRDRIVEQLTANVRRDQQQLERSQAALSSYLAGTRDDAELIPLKVAASEWGIGEEAARKRVKRGNLQVRGEGRQLWITRAQLRSG